MNIQKVQEFYTDWLGVKDYYHIMKSYVNSDSTEFINSNTFLHGIEINNKIIRKEIDTKIGDMRIDVPVWFGDISKAKLRYVVLGLEPRDTNKMFNVERVKNKVFGAPFGADRWNINSSVRGKNQNKYFRVFEDHINDANCFILFSDVVKFFHIKYADKGTNDSEARSLFNRYAQDELTFLKKELKIINPHKIITLGNDTYNVVNSLIGNKFEIIKLRHPAQGGEKLAKEKLQKLTLVPQNDINLKKSQNVTNSIQISDAPIRKQNTQINKMNKKKNREISINEYPTIFQTGANKGDIICGIGYGGADHIGLKIRVHDTIKPKNEILNVDFTIEELGNSFLKYPGLRQLENSVIVKNDAKNYSDVLDLNFFTLEKFLPSTQKRFKPRDIAIIHKASSKSIIPKGTKVEIVKIFKYPDEAKPKDTYYKVKSNNHTPPSPKLDSGLT